MVADIMRRYDLTDDDKRLYTDWLKTPLAEKIDAVVDANTYKYEFWLVYSVNGYRRVGDLIDIRSYEIPLYRSSRLDLLENELEVLALIDNTMEQVKGIIN